MLTMNDLKLGGLISLNGEPYMVLEKDFMKKAKRRPVMRTKLRNLISGKVLEKTFQQGDRIEEAEVTKVKSQFLYHDEKNSYFMNQDNFEQFFLPKEILGRKAEFLKEGQELIVLFFADKPINVELPKKITLLVTQAPPGIKGDSVQNITKEITLETGAKINAPLFIKEGDKIRINTDTGEYVERAE